MNKKQVAHYWAQFLAEQSLDSNTEYFECFHFDNNEKDANALLNLVLKGQKKATCSSLYCYQNKADMLPRTGDYSIVTDWAGTPKCIIKTTKVTVLPFGDITFDLAKREGEDNNLESWRTHHVNFFTQDSQKRGYTFNWNMPVVFEDFKVVYQ